MEIFIPTGPEEIARIGSEGENYSKDTVRLAKAQNFNPLKRIGPMGFNAQLR